MKKIIASILLSVSIISMANAAEPKKLFAGVEISPGWGGGLSITGAGGYTHYFDRKHWIADQFRHGVRGIGEVTYSNYLGLDLSALWISGSAEWIIDFNPTEKNVWGAFAGLGLGIHTWSGYRTYTSMFAELRLGGRYTMDDTHSFEVSLFKMGVIGLGYKYHF